MQGKGGVLCWEKFHRLLRYVSWTRRRTRRLQTRTPCVALNLQSLGRLTAQILL